MDERYGACDRQNAERDVGRSGGELRSLPTHAVFAQMMAGLPKRGSDLVEKQAAADDYAVELRRGNRRLFRKTTRLLF